MEFRKLDPVETLARILDDSLAGWEERYLVVTAQAMVAAWGGDDPTPHFDEARRIEQIHGQACIEIDRLRTPDPGT